jgi:Tfp pilus assembly protein PilO
MKPIQQWTSKDIVDYVNSIDKKTWVKIIVAAIVIALFFWFIAEPAWIKRIQIIRRVKDIDARVAKFEALRSSKPKMIEEREEASRFIQHAKERLYAQHEISLLLGTISRFAESSHVTIVSSSPRDISKEKEFPEPFNQQYRQTLYDFTVEGSYHDLGKFTALIESSPKLLKIQKFNILKKESDPQVEIVELTLSATSYKS